MKKTLGGINALYPTPTVIVGAVVDGRPNFITIAHIGIVNHAKPYLISISMGKVHYTNPGIRENKEFSVNVPSEVRPLLFDMHTVKYWSLGHTVASCWSVGKQLKK